MGIGVVSSGTNQMIQMNQLDRQLTGQVADRAQQQRQRADATITEILDNRIASQQQAMKSATQSLKGSSIDTYA
jgi:hypothetical protein